MREGNYKIKNTKSWDLIFTQKLLSCILQNPVKFQAKPFSTYEVISILVEENFSIASNWYRQKSINATSGAGYITYVLVIVACMCNCV